MTFQDLGAILRKKYPAIQEIVVKSREYTYTWVLRLDNFSYKKNNLVLKYKPYRIECKERMATACKKK